MTADRSNSQIDVPEFSELLISQIWRRNLIILTTAAFLSSVVVNTYNGENILVAAGLVVSVIMFFCLWRVYRYPSDRLADSIFLYAMAIAILFPVYINIFYGSLWSHIVNVCAFVLLRKSAAIRFNCVYILVVTGTVFLAADALVALRMAGTSALLVVLTYALVTNIEERSMALVRKVEQLKKAESVKAEFVANMSHEMRTPLTAVLGYSEAMLINNNLDEPDKEKIRSILVGAQHLSGLVDDVLDMTKADEGRLSVTRVSTELMPVLNALKRILEPTAQAKGIEFSLVTCLPLPRYICTDPLRLKQILMNLVGNAIKFTDDGTVELSVDYDLNKQSMVFRISDTGIGIPEEFHSKLFERFSQDDTSISRNYGGSGLGLFISQELASLLQANLEYIPQDKGSIFQLTLTDQPTADDWITAEQSATEINAHLPHAVKQHEGRVLIVDDSPVNQHLIELLLQKSGLECSMASNGREAVNMLREQHFDVVLMDIQMPIMSGVEATKAIRVFNPEVPIVALSADVLRHSRESLEAQGFTDFLSKPIDIIKMQQTLAQLFPARA